MPILRVDKFGRLYESSRDRADGLGYNRHADAVNVSDLTLDAVYLTQQENQKREALKHRMLSAAQDEQARMEKVRQARNARLAQLKAQNEELLRQNRSVQNNLIRGLMPIPVLNNYGAPDVQVF